ncbi:hypothetical protein [Nocardioides sp. SR21]|uniref:hypothetical protein n=1 Tax=Nocardioides sp. SR21 TaxID=2919501 RepID=UPI001FAA7E96|nr:hypothetical protein [Nocardioides sp. SR21]
MTVQASSSRSATKSIGAAFVNLVITLVICIAILLAFLIAPLVALGLAYLAYVVWRPRSGKKSSAPAAPGEPRQPGAASHGFGAGAS